MKFVVSLIIIALLSFAACLYLPWWSISIIGFIVLLFIPQRPGLAFLCAFLAVFLLWAGLSFWISANNGHILAHKMSAVILGADNPVLLIIVTGFIGGLIAGLGGLAGGLVRYIYIKR